MEPIVFQLPHVRKQIQQEDVLMVQMALAYSKKSNFILRISTIVHNFHAGRPTTKHMNIVSRSVRNVLPMDTNVWICNHYATFIRIRKVATLMIREKLHKVELWFQQVNVFGIIIDVGIRNVGI
jgi:hypothetical protein